MKEANPNLNRLRGDDRVNGARPGCRQRACRRGGRWTGGGRSGRGYSWLQPPLPPSAARKPAGGEEKTSMKSHRRMGTGRSVEAGEKARADAIAGANHVVQI